MAAAGYIKNASLENVRINNLTLDGTFNSNLNVRIASVDGLAADAGTVISATTAATAAGQTFGANTFNILDIIRTANDVYGFQLPLLSETSAGDIIKVMLTKNAGDDTNSIYHINVKGTDKIYGIVSAVHQMSATVANNGSVLGEQNALIVCDGKGQVVLRVATQHFGGEAGTTLTFVNRNSEIWEISGILILNSADNAHTLATVTTNTFAA
jgi:hypothetical protein